MTPLVKLGHTCMEIWVPGYRQNDSASVSAITMGKSSIPDSEIHGL